jgi:hypothetical protein
VPLVPTHAISGKLSLSKVQVRPISSGSIVQRMVVTFRDMVKVIWCRFYPCTIIYCKHIFNKRTNKISQIHTLQKYFSPGNPKRENQHILYSSSHTLFTIQYTYRIM